LLPRHHHQGDEYSLLYFRETTPRYVPEGCHLQLNHAFCCSHYIENRLTGLDKQVSNQVLIVLMFILCLWTLKLTSFLHKPWRDWGAAIESQITIPSKMQVFL
jgi:hypothetical protein